MTKDEYNEAKALVSEIEAGDVRLGRVLHTMLDHIAAAHKVNTAPEAPAVEEAPVEEAPTPSRRSRT